MPSPACQRTTFVARRDADLIRALREREQVAPGAVIVPSRVFFFNDAATTEIYTLSLHDALPILSRTVPEERAGRGHQPDPGSEVRRCLRHRAHAQRDVVTLRDIGRAHV